MKKQITTRQYFLTLNLTYYLQTFSVVLFALVSAFLISQRKDAPEDDAMWRLVVPTLMLVGLVLAYFIFRLMVGKIKAEQPLKQKMPLYAQAILVRSLLLEIPGFLAAIAAYLTAQYYYLGAAFLIVVVFFILRPTRSKIAFDLNLQLKDKLHLENENAIIGEVNQRK